MNTAHKNPLKTIQLNFPQHINEENTDFKIVLEEVVKIFGISEDYLETLIKNNEKLPHSNKSYKNLLTKLNKTIQTLSRLTDGAT